jgi:hypothetical protein
MSDHWTEDYDLVAIEHPSGGWQVCAGSKYIQDHISGYIPYHYCIHAPGAYHATPEEALACREFGGPDEDGR